MVKPKAMKPAPMTSAAGPSPGLTLFMAREVYDPTLGRMSVMIP
jgi:hypothetical protein